MKKFHYLPCKGEGRGKNIGFIILKFEFSDILTLNLLNKGDINKVVNDKIHELIEIWMEAIDIPFT